MKAIKIDVTQQNVYIIDIENALEPIYNALECDSFSVVHVRENNDALYIDDEGLLKDPDQVQGAFAFSDYPYQTLFGHGLFIGTDWEGDSKDVSSSLQEIKDKIIFLNKGDGLKALQKELLQRPITVTSW
jgi:hypothetical protein